MESPRSDKWADVPRHWSFIGLEWVHWPRGIQWVVVWCSNPGRRLVHRSAHDDGSAPLKFSQRRTQPSTFQMGLFRLAVHT